jgi:D-alanine-D-alanine ligase-like ATP-grasp enzyme
MTLLRTFGKGVRHFVRSYLQYRDTKRYWDSRLSEFENSITVELWRAAALRLDLEAERCGPLLRIASPRDGRGISILGLDVSFESVVAYHVCGDKPLSHQLLRQAGIRVPEGRAFSRDDYASAIAYAHALQRPCVVKPARGTANSMGVSLDLRGEKEIRRAFRRAALYCDEVLVEEFLSGEPYRFLVHRSKCVSAVRRDMPAVTGNGKDSLWQLVHTENATRVQGYLWTPGHSFLMAFKTDDHAAKALAAQGYQWNSVPEHGRRVEVSDQREYVFGASYHEVLDEADPALVRAAECAAVAAGGSLVGVDLLCPDLRSKEYCVNEVNTSPGVFIHYAMEQGCRDPLRRVLEIELGLELRSESAMGTNAPL